MTIKLGDCLRFSLLAGNNFWTLYREKKIPAGVTPSQWDDLKLVGDSAITEVGTFLHGVGDMCENYLNNMGCSSERSIEGINLNKHWCGYLLLNVGKSKVYLWMKLIRETGEFFFGIYADNKVQRQKIRTTWGRLKVHFGSELNHPLLQGGWEHVIMFPGFTFTASTSDEEIAQFVNDTLSGAFGNQLWKQVFA